MRKTQFSSCKTFASSKFDVPWSCFFMEKAVKRRFLYYQNIIKYISSEADVTPTECFFHVNKIRNRQLIFCICIYTHKTWVSSLFTLLTQKKTVSKYSLIRWTIYEVKKLFISFPSANTLHLYKHTRSTSANSREMQRSSTGDIIYVTPSLRRAILYSRF